MFEFDEIVEDLDIQHYGCRERKGIQSWRGLQLVQVVSLLKSDVATVLRAMREVAKRYPVRAGERRCTSCGMPITFGKNRVPLDREGKNHFTTCPNPSAHTRR